MITLRKWTNTREGKKKISPIRLLISMTHDQLSASSARGVEEGLRIILQEEPRVTELNSKILAVKRLSYTIAEAAYPAK